MLFRHGCVPFHVQRLYHHSGILVQQHSVIAEQVTRQMLSEVVNRCFSCALTGAKTDTCRILLRLQLACDGLSAAEKPRAPCLDESWHQHLRAAAQLFYKLYTYFF